MSTLILVPWCILSYLVVFGIRNSMALCGSANSCGPTLLALLLIGLSNGAIIALNALGFTLVYGAVRTINLAHGDLFGLVSALVAWIFVSSIRHIAPSSTSAFGPLALALGAAMLGGAALNLVVERVAFRPFRGQPRMAPFIATIAVSFILFQIAVGWRVPRAVPALLPQTELLAVGRLRLDGREFDYVYRLPDLLVLLLAITLTLLVAWFLGRTRYGRAIQAWSQDWEMAQLCGIPGRQTIQLVFALGGALAGAAAFAFTTYYRHPADSYGLESGLVAFSAAVLGGIGRPYGAFFSGLFIGVLSALSDLFLTETWTPVAVLALLIAVLVLRPTGLSSADGDMLSAGDDQLLARGGAQIRQSRWPTIALIAAGAAYPLIDRALGLNEVIAAIGLLFFVLLTLGLTIGLGFAGLLNLGYAACFALGGYTAALLSTHYGPIAAFARVDSFALVLALSAAVAGGFGALLALLTRRMSGDYLAIVTLAAAQIVQRILFNLSYWTGGRGGMAAQPPPRLFGAGTTPPVAWYYVVFGATLITTLVCARLRNSRQGRAWIALREDMVAALSCGIDATRARLLALALSAAIAGAAGACYASIIAYVDPNQADFRISAMVVAMVVIGGAGNIVGGVMGALAIATIDQLAIPKAGAWLARLAAAPEWHWLSFLDLRALNLLAFGLALYLAVVLQARRQASDRVSLAAAMYNKNDIQN